MARWRLSPVSQCSNTVLQTARDSQNMNLGLFVAKVLYRNLSYGLADSRRTIGIFIHADAHVTIGAADTSAAHVVVRSADNLAVVIGNIVDSVRGNSISHDIGFVGLAVFHIANLHACTGDVGVVKHYHKQFRI